MLEFLAGRCGAPSPLAVAVGADAPISALLMEVGRGTPADRPEHLTEPGRVITVFAEQLSSLHALPVDGCPVVVDLDVVARDAEARVAAGLVDPDTFDVAHLDLEPEELLGHARALVHLVHRRPPPPLVVVHGRYRLEHLLLDPSDPASGARLTAWDRAGLGDPAVDLAAAARSIVRRLGPEALPAFFAAYRGPEPDAVRLEAYALLDQLR